MARIGLFGGTFDPVHTGHMALAEQVREQMELHRIILLPAGNPPHKSERDITDKMHRFRMLRIAAASHPHFFVSDYEILKETPNYSYQTISDFKEMYPDDEIFFIVGGDSFVNFPKWKEYRKLLTLCPFIVVSRPGIAPEAYFENFCGDETPPRVFFIRDAQYDISSTRVRSLLTSGETPADLLPEGVADYIKEHRLYENRSKS